MARSEILLTELDRGLERRGHAFCRYADDCTIYIRSQAAGERVLAGISQILTERLKLKVNEPKNLTAKARRRKDRKGNNGLIVLDHSPYG